MNSYHQQYARQDFSKSVNEYSQINNCSKNTNSAILKQKVQLLEFELKQYKFRQSQSRKLNQSIINTYSNIKHCDQEKQRENKDIQISELIIRHKQQIRKLKNEHQKEKLVLQSSLKTQRQKKNNLQIQINKLKMQKQKSLIDQRAQLQQQFGKKITQSQQNLIKQIKELEQSVQQQKRLVRGFRQYIDKNYMFGNQMGQFERNQLIYDKNIKSQTFQRRQYQNPAKHNTLLSNVNQNNLKKVILTCKKQDLTNLNKKLSRALRQINIDKKKQLNKVAF